MAVTRNVASWPSTIAESAGCTVIAAAAATAAGCTLSVAMEEVRGAAPAQLTTTR